mmetsp:Transcript_18852/g.33667  ORF Transcript_18852/g.33667 Transcript_18852/m.33667 type:complete len:316 (-) Transcript_18852:184-1131(-)
MTLRNSKVPKSKGSGPDSLRLEYAALLVTGSGVINTPEALPFSTLTADNDGAIALALTSASCESSKSSCTTCPCGSQRMPKNSSHISLSGSQEDSSSAPESKLSLKASNASFSVSWQLDSKTIGAQDMTIGSPSAPMEYTNNDRPMMLLKIARFWSKNGSSTPHFRLRPPTGQDSSLPPCPNVALFVELQMSPSSSSSSKGGHPKPPDIVGSKISRASPHAAAPMLGSASAVGSTLPLFIWYRQASSSGSSKQLKPVTESSKFTCTKTPSVSHNESSIKPLSCPGVSSLNTATARFPVRRPYWVPESEPCPQALC